MAINVNTLRDLSYGLYLVSSISGEKVNAQIANTVFQVTADPATIALSINKKNFTHELIEAGGLAGISVLEIDTPLKFIGSFGFRSGRDADKLDGINTLSGPGGCPMVTDYSLSVMELRIVGKADAGTHTIFIGEIVSAEKLKNAAPMTYAYYHKVKKGMAPSTAPTYIAANSIKKEGRMMKYVCQICGYIYDPEEGDPDGNIEAGTPFEDLPDDWTCPVCGAEKDEFDPEEAVAN